MVLLFMVKRFCFGNRRGELLIENIVFMILNLAFLSILILFLVNQGGSASLYEEAYSKQIALLLDSAKPGMIMKINFEKGMKIADKAGFFLNDTVVIDNELNKVHVKFSDSGGKEYHFFNDVFVYAYPDTEEGEYNGMYVIVVDKEGEGE
jgi:hypothetical protein